MSFSAGIQLARISKHLITELKYIPLRGINYVNCMFYVIFNKNYGECDFEKKTQQTAFQ